MRRYRIHYLVACLSLLSMLVLAACDQGAIHSAQPEMPASHQEATADKIAETTFSSQLDLAAIKSMNLSSLSGLWENELGDQLSFNKEGLVSEVSEINAAFDKNAVLELNVVTKDRPEEFNYSILVLPAGQVLPNDMFVQPSEDASDISRDRLLVIYTQTDLESGAEVKSKAYYKVAD